MYKDQAYNGDTLPKEKKSRMSSFNGTIYTRNRVVGARADRF